MYSRIFFAFLLFLGWFSVAEGGYRDKIGYARLQTELGDSIPDGSGIAVTQSETTSNGNYMPDISHDEFASDPKKTITPQSGPSGASDNDGALDGPERDFWANQDCSAWNCSSCLTCDFDNDGEPQSILDPDSDGDSFLDGVEIQYNSDPTDSESQPEIDAVPAISQSGLWGVGLLLAWAGPYALGRRKRESRSIRESG